jgi:hypothetical protein
MPAWRRPGLLVVGLWCLFLATNAGRNATNDVVMRQVVARQLWTAGTATFTELPPGTAGFAWVPTGPGRWVAPYGVGQSLLFVPFDMLGALLERVSPASWRDRVGWLPIGLLLLPLLGVASWAAMRALLREWGLPDPWPVAGASVMMLATLLFHYAGDGQEEMLVGLLLTLAMLFAIRLRRQPSARVAALCGLCAGAAFVTRSVSMFALLIVPVLVFSASADRRSRIRLLAVMGAAAAATGSVALWYNHARFGSPFTVGYDRLGHFSKIAFDRRSPGVIATLLFGPGVGLFVLSPALLIGGFGTGQLWRRDRWYLLGALLAYGSCYFFFSCWHDSYTGGVAWGTRYQCHLLPILALPVTLGLRRLVALRSGVRIVLAVLSLSLVVQALSVITTEQLEYFQASCDRTLPDAIDAPMQNSLVYGQLRRRVDNVARWILRRPPPAVGDTACQATTTLMWDRYMPNFWGPVFAHRMARGGTVLIGLWAGLLLAGVGMVAVGLERALRVRSGDLQASAQTG